LVDHEARIEELTNKHNEVCAELVLTRQKQSKQQQELERCIALEKFTTANNTMLKDELDKEKQFSVKAKREHAVTKALIKTMQREQGKQQEYLELLMDVENLARDTVLSYPDMERALQERLSAIIVLCEKGTDNTTGN